MKKLLSLCLFVSALFFSFERLAVAQTKPEKTLSEHDKNGPKMIALKTGELAELEYDAGTLRMLA